MQKEIDGGVVELRQLNVNYPFPVYAETGSKDIGEIEKSVEKRLQDSVADSSIESSDLELIDEINSEAIREKGSSFQQSPVKRVVTRNLDIF